MPKRPAKRPLWPHLAAPPGDVQRPLNAQSFPPPGGGQRASLPYRLGHELPEYTGQRSEVSEDREEVSTSSSGEPCHAPMRKVGRWFLREPTSLGSAQHDTSPCKPLRWAARKASPHPSEGKRDEPRPLRAAKGRIPSRSQTNRWPLSWRVVRPAPGRSWSLSPSRLMVSVKPTAMSKFRARGPARLPTLVWRPYRAPDTPSSAR